MRAPATASPLVRRAAAVAAVALTAIAIAVVLSRSGGGGDHTLRAAFQSVINLVPGNEVRLAGRKVGEIGSIDEADGQAVVKLELQNGAAWPLHRGTTARIRYGSLTAYAGRYVELVPGPASAPVLGDGGILSTADTVTPVEFDQIWRTFDRPTRGNLQALVRNLDDALAGHAGDLGRGLAQGGVGFQQLADFMGDLGYDPHALRTLVVSGARTSAALRRREGELRSLLDHAAQTIGELAAHARAQQATLERFPAALRTGRLTLGRLDVSLAGLQGLVDDLRPGATGLRALAPSVAQTAGALLDIAPLATATLSTGARAAPDIDRFLRSGTPFMPQLGAVLGQLAPMVACVRPYGPEIAGQITDWAAFQGNYDQDGHYQRADQQKPPFPPGTKFTSEEIVHDLFRDKIFYAMPRPPGLGVGQPWFIRTCGAGRDAVDVTKDPELSGGPK